MCLAIPVLVRSIAADEAEVEIGGISRRISIILTPEVRVGDYVLLHAGYAINAIDEEEAEETLRMFEEMAYMEEAQDRHNPSQVRQDSKK
jgi:hydrogenase expression/formation protein HypC